MSVSVAQSEDAELGKPWTNRDVLYDFYWNRELTQEEVGDELGCHYKTVMRWMDRLNIPTRKDVSVSHHIERRDGKDGYSKWNDGNTTVLVHRLAAVAEFGFDAVVEADNIHHKSGYKFDNRHENFDLVSHAEHGRIHSNEAEWTVIDGYPQLII